MNDLLKYNFFTYSSKGARPFQEDYLLVKPERGVFALSDGFGGAVNTKQDRASFACESVIDFIENKMGDTDATLPFEIRKYYTLGANVIFNALLYANQNLLRKNEKKAINEMSGASVCAGFLSQGRLAIGNNGVCRGYLIRNGEKVSLIQPRSYFSFLGEKKGSESLDDFPLSALGIFEDTQPEITEYQLRDEDICIFMTDGFGNHLDEWLKNYKLNKFNYDDLFKNLEKKLTEIESLFEDNSSLILVKVKK